MLWLRWVVIVLCLGWDLWWVSWVEICRCRKLVGIGALCVSCVVFRGLLEKEYLEGRGAAMVCYWR